MEFLFAQPALFTVGADQGSLGGTRARACRGKADRWSDAAYAVQAAIGFGDEFRNFVASTEHSIGRYGDVLDLAFEGGWKAGAHDGDPAFEIIGVHGVLLCSPRRLFHKH